MYISFRGKSFHSFLPAWKNKEYIRYSSYDNCFYTRKTHYHKKLLNRRSIYFRGLMLAQRKDALRRVDTYKTWYHIMSAGVHLPRDKREQWWSAYMWKDV